MDIERNKITGARLRKLRTEAGLTQLEVATRLSKTQSFVSKVENAERELSLVESFLYAEALGTTYNVLYEEVHEGLAEAGLDSIGEQLER